MKTRLSFLLALAAAAGLLLFLVFRVNHTTVFRHSFDCKLLFPTKKENGNDVCMQRKDSMLFFHSKWRWNLRTTGEDIMVGKCRKHINIDFKYFKKQIFHCEKWRTLLPSAIWAWW